MTVLVPTWLEPDWPAPAQVRALSTTRRGGLSVGTFASFNLGAHVGDDPAAVQANRHTLIQAAELPGEPLWLNQVHGVQIVRAEDGGTPQADGSFSLSPNIVCAVLTADCLPVLLCDRAGTRVAALHAGWRGLAAGVVEAGVRALGSEDLLAWLGPAIGPSAFEVGEEVRDAFVRQDASAAAAFVPVNEGHWLADLFELGRLALGRAGVVAVYGGYQCTYSDAERFFSYRRDGTTGRMATLIWRCEV